MHKGIQLIVQLKKCPFYENTHSLNEFDENSNHTKFQNLRILKNKGCQAKDSFKKSLCKNIMFNGFKMFSFRCRSHVQEIIFSNMIDRTH